MLHPLDKVVFAGLGLCPAVFLGTNGSAEVTSAAQK